MPLAGITMELIGIAFALHAYRTGRPQIWMYILIFLPLVGTIAYILFELVPELANSRRVRRVATDIKTIVDPDREWRKLGERARDNDTVDAKRKFAEECERKGMWAEAIVLYRQAAQGMYADDPDLLRGLARAQLGAGDAVAAVATLDKLRAAHPGYQSQDAHLTYARALEAQSRLPEAAAEYRTLVGYFVGVEARTRYGLLLQKTGEPEVAKRLFEEAVRVAKTRNALLRPEERDWVKVAQRNV
jgi:hypothetical protein